MLDLTVEGGACTAVSGQIIDCTGTTTPITGLSGAGNVLLPDDRTQGLVLSFVSSPIFSGGESHEVWLEIGMLATRLPEHGFGGKLDYDWFFGSKPNGTGSGYAFKERDLRDLPEAQARVIAVSPPVRLA